MTLAATLEQRARHVLSPKQGSFECMPHRLGSLGMGSSFNHIVRAYLATSVEAFLKFVEQLE